MLMIFCLFILGIIFLIGVSIFLVKYGTIKNNKFIKRIGIVACTIMCVALIIYIGFEGLYIYKMNTYKTVDNVGKYNYEVILGGGLNGRNPGILLKNRLDLGIKYLEKYPESKVIVSGGQGPNEEVSEAYAMKNYLIDNGIDKNRIIEENKSITTVQNIVNSDRILKSLGAGNEPILIVSNKFHLYRAQLIADLLGIRNSGIASNSNLRLKIEYTILAFPSTLKSLINAEKYKMEQVEI